MSLLAAPILFDPNAVRSVAKLDEDIVVAENDITLLEGMLLSETTL